MSGRKIAPWIHKPAGTGGFDCGSGAGQLVITHSAAMKRTRRTPVDATVTLAGIQIAVSTSPAAKGYEIDVKAHDPKSEVTGLPLPLAKPVRFQIGESASPKGLIPVVFQIRLRNSPPGSANYDPSALPTSVYWQGALTGNATFVFVLPKEQGTQRRNGAGNNS